MARRLNSGTPPAAARASLAAAVGVTVPVLLALAALSWIWDLPRPLPLWMGGTFVAWSGAFWGVRWRRPPPRALALWVVLPWGCVVALFLGTVRHLDRGGWLWYRITGYDVPATEQLPLPELEDLIRRHPFVVRDPRDPAHLVLRRGVHTIGATLVVPAGSLLRIEPGTVLRFTAGRSLIAYSPIIARGTAAEPITFTARHRWLKWGVVGIVGAGPSAFDHVRFEHGGRARVNGIDFPGTLSVVGSAVEIAESEFASIFGKDAVHVRKGRIRIGHSSFLRAVKDCLDLDDSRGEIHDNRFLQCGDDAIDLEASDDVRISGNSLPGSRGAGFASDP